MALRSRRTVILPNDTASTKANGGLLQMATG
jgi:hypothetical protein